MTMIQFACQLLMFGICKWKMHGMKSWIANQRSSNSQRRRWWRWERREEKKIMRNWTKVVWWEKWRNYFVVCSVSFANHFVQFILSYITRTTFMASTSHWVQVLVTPFESQPFTRTLNCLDDTANAPVQSLLRANKWSCTIYSMKNFLFIVHYVSRRWLPTTVRIVCTPNDDTLKVFSICSASISLPLWIVSAAPTPHLCRCCVFVVSQRGVAAIFNYLLENMAFELRSTQRRRCEFYANINITQITIRLLPEIVVHSLVVSRRFTSQNIFQIRDELQMPSARIVSRMGQSINRIAAT